MLEAPPPAFLWLLEGRHQETVALWSSSGAAVATVYRRASTTQE